MTTPLPRYRTKEGEAAYRAAYQRTLALWPDERKSIWVKTRFGDTHVNQLGPRSAPPMLMIHGFGFSGAQWYPNAPTLAVDYCVYAPDVPDQFGLSTLDKPIKTVENYAIWLTDLLDGLGIEQAPLIGHSYGGWLATNFALYCPERVTRLTLISPAATFVPLSWQFYVRGIYGGMTGNERIIYSMVKWMTTLEEVRGIPIVEQFKIGLQTMAQLPVGQPTLFTPEAFRKLTMPVDLIIGDHEVVYSKPVSKVIEIARQMIQNLQVVQIVNGGHAVTLDQPEATNRELIRFNCVTQN